MTPTCHMREGRVMTLSDRWKDATRANAPNGRKLSAACWLGEGGSRRLHLTQIWIRRLACQRRPQPSAALAHVIRQRAA